jgi:predicted FMN-binding regulatory protein PaiB
MCSFGYLQERNQEEIRAFLIQSSFGFSSIKPTKSCALRIPLELNTNKEGKYVFYWVIFQRKHTMERLWWCTKFYFRTPILYLVLIVQSRKCTNQNYIAVHIHGKIKIIEAEAVTHSLKSSSTNTNRTLKTLFE